MSTVSRSLSTFWLEGPDEGEVALLEDVAALLAGLLVADEAALLAACNSLLLAAAVEPFLFGDLKTADIPNVAATAIFSSSSSILSSSSLLMKNKTNIVIKIQYYA